MLLCLDVGNTHILGGVFEKSNLILRFRYATHLIGTADQLGIFLINLLQTKKINPEQITDTALSSVVPSVDFTIQHMLIQYFQARNFTLQAGVKTGLNIKYKNFNEVGSDRIANAIGAVGAFPNKNVIIADLGTATTVCAVTKNRDYLGGSILPGLRLSMEALKNNAAKLMEVNIETPLGYLGRTMRDSIQSGLYYGHLGALKELTCGFKKIEFNNESVMIIGTGGFSQLFKDENIFDVIVPDLVLQGLRQAQEYSLLDGKSNQ